LTKKKGRETCVSYDGQIAVYAQFAVAMFELLCEGTSPDKSKVLADTVIVNPVASFDPVVTIA
jgi:hypothetical protein